MYVCVCARACACLCLFDMETTEFGIFVYKAASYPPVWTGCSHKPGAYTEISVAKVGSGHECKDPVSRIVAMSFVSQGVANV